MVHLEVTGKENRALCITNGDRDKHSEALRDLDKRLSKHVQAGNSFCFFFCFFLVWFKHTAGEQALQSLPFFC